MTLLRETLQDEGSGVAMADDPRSLAAFLEPGVAAAIWRRRPAPEFQDWIDALPDEALPSARVILRPDAVRDAMAVLCDGVGLPRGLQVLRHLLRESPDGRLPDA